MNGLNRDPYANVNWQNVEHIPGCTHAHCPDQKSLDRLIAGGMEFFTLANYYPSAPYYPLDSICENTFRMGQYGCCRNGKYLKEYVDFTPYSGVTDPGRPLFSALPPGSTEAPNAEHHWFSDHNVYLHITSPGSSFASSNFDIRNQYKLAEAGFQLGLPIPWRKAFDMILDSLIEPDGGGIVIAHPQWSHLPVDFLCEMLDHDERVPGIEILNTNSEVDYSDACESVWDEVLRTGRQCYGFCVQDHLQSDTWRGKIILLPEERTQKSLLKALRDGRFYGAVTGEVKFEYISFDGKTFRAACSEEVFFQVISRRGVETESSGREIAFDVPRNMFSQYGYLRLDARFGRRREKLFTQPVWLE